jgi:hypothetical protein
MMDLEGRRLPHGTGLLVKALVARLPPLVGRRLRQAYYGSRRLREAYHGFLYARGLLSDPITFTSAVANIQNRLANRTTVFLDTMEQTVFAYPNSPYRALLEGAGYDPARLRALVGQAGVEETLRRLARDGVYVTVEEFKGIREARRGNCIFRFGQGDFNNPLAQRGRITLSGGTRSQGIPTSSPVANGRLNAEHTAVTWTAYGLDGLPVVVWYPEWGDIGAGTVLNAAARRTVPVRWLKQLPGHGSYTYVHHLGIKAGALARGIILPPLTHVPVGSEAAILPWITQAIYQKGCAVVTSPSSALRLALAAKRGDTSLANLTFLTTGEPLTPAKLAAIRAVGARAFSRFGFNELDASAAFGCASPGSPDDMHICRDRVAVIQRRRTVDRIGNEVDALLFTSLRSDGGRILLNMETGDYGRLSARRCGCLLEAVGWPDHLGEVRSFEKLTPEGGTFLGSNLISLVEEILPAQFGGDPTDYQLLEHEDQDGFTRLTILVHPRLDAIDERAVLECAERTLESANWIITHVFKGAGTLRVRRGAPMMTRAGKVMPLHHLEREQAPGAANAL